MTPSDAQEVDSFTLWQRQYALDLDKYQNKARSGKEKKGIRGFTPKDINSNWVIRLKLAI